MSVDAWTRQRHEHPESTRPMVEPVNGAHPSPNGTALNGHAVAAAASSVLTDPAGPLDPYAGSPDAGVVTSPRRVTHRFSIESSWASLAKRVVDLAVGIPLSLVMVLAFPWVALAVKATSRGPVLFRQVRIGQGGQPIVVYKFRSMHIDAEARLRRDEALYSQYVANGFKVPADADPRITPIGRFLRRSSLDELPQAICLLRGTMSCVGPRPVVPDELRELYGDEPEPYLACKPGLTGLWQTSGRSTVVHGERARLDAEYAQDWSLGLDLKILVRTIPVVLSTHGAH